MAPSSVACLGLATLLAARSYAVPIVPANSLAARGRCVDDNGFIVGTMRDCSQLVPAVTLPSASYVWRRDDANTEDSSQGNKAFIHPRDDYTHEKAPYVYIAPQGNHGDSGAGSGTLPSASNDDKTLGSGQGQPWGIVPEPRTIGVPKFTLPVEKPAPMVRRVAKAEHALGADLVVHQPAVGIWLRDENPKEGDRSHNDKQSYPHFDSVTPQSDRSEAEQLFEQSRGAVQTNPNEAKLTIMRLAQDLYRREVPDAMSPGGGKNRVPVNTQPQPVHQGPGDADPFAYNMARLTTLYPAENVYRRSQNVESASQNVQEPNGGNNIAPFRSIHDAIAAINGEQNVRPQRRSSQNVATDDQTAETMNQIAQEQTGDENIAPLNRIYDAISALNGKNNVEHMKRSSQNIELIGQNAESTSQVGGENVAAVKNLHDVLTALIGKGHLKSRSIMLPQEPGFLKHDPRPKYILPVLYERDSGIHTILKNVKDKLDTTKPAPGSKSTGGDTGDAGDSASGDDTTKPSPGQADSESSSKKRSQPLELDTKILKRLSEYKDILGGHDWGHSSPAVSHYTSNTVYRRDAETDLSENFHDRLIEAIGEHNKLNSGAPAVAHSPSDTIYRREAHAGGLDTGALASVEDIQNQDFDYSRYERKLEFGGVAQALAPSGRVYRRNSDDESLDEEFDDVERSVPAPDLQIPDPNHLPLPPNDASDHTSPGQQEYDDALAGMRAAITQFIELCKNPIVLQHLETDSVEKCQSKVRKALKHVNSKNSTSTTPGNGHASGVDMALDSIFARDVDSDDDKDQKKADREVEVSQRAWQKYQDVCGGLLAFACEPKCSPSDPWPCIPQPAVMLEPWPTVEKRGRVTKPETNPINGDTAGQPEEVPGSPKHRVLNQLRSVYRRDATFIDRVVPGIPTPNVHKYTNVMFRRDNGEQEDRKDREHETIVLDSPSSHSIAAWVYKDHRSKHERRSEGFVAPNALNSESGIPPQYQVHVTQDSVFRGSQKRDVDESSERRIRPSSPNPEPKVTPVPAPAPEPVDVEDAYPPKYWVKVPADSVFRTTTQEGVMKRGDGDRVLGSNIKVSGNLPVVMGMAADVHRRDHTATYDEGRAMKKRCYGHNFGSELCVLGPEDTVYSSFGGGYREDENEKESKKEEKEKKKDEKEKKKNDDRRDVPEEVDKRTICNPGFGSCAHQPVDSVYKQDLDSFLSHASAPQPFPDPIPASPPSRIDVRKRCYTTNLSSEYCQLHKAPEVYMEREKDKTERRGDGPAMTPTGDTRGDAQVKNGGDEKQRKEDEKEKKRKAKEEERARKKAEKEREKEMQGDLD